MNRFTIALPRKYAPCCGAMSSMSSLRAAAAQRFQVERDLRHAIGAQELRLYVQPQVNVRGQVTGVEALVRWQHPRDGLLTPGAFIPLAEESDLIVSLGEWVLAQACAVVAQPDFSQRRLRMSVNLSARQFREDGFVPSLRRALTQGRRVLVVADHGHTPYLHRDLRVGAGGRGAGEVVGKPAPRPVPPDLVGDRPDG